MTNLLHFTIRLEDGTFNQVSLPALPDEHQAPRAVGKCLIPNDPELTILLRSFDSEAFQLAMKLKEESLLQVGQSSSWVRQVIQNLNGLRNCYLKQLSGAIYNGS